ncbi:hypothetical protein HMPREF0262_00574 [Clostridium sp. ATCC 29733]|nr:hypothetical protein HMPREF0262_00574 [Clostridium sp. ATCC 29733]
MRSCRTARKNTPCCRAQQGVFLHPDRQDGKKCKKCRFSINLIDTKYISKKAKMQGRIQFVLTVCNKRRRGIAANG